jgi:peroxiredoxin
VHPSLGFEEHASGQARRSFVDREDAVRLFFVICLSVVTLAFFWSDAPPKDLPGDFTFAAIDGTTIDARSLKGAPVVMVVGASWCPECRKEAREFEKAYRAYKDKGVVFIGVLGNSSDDQIKDFVQTYKLTFPVGKDNGIADAFGVRLIPQTFFFSRDGKFIKKIVGDASYKEISLQIEKILVK